MTPEVWSGSGSSVGSDESETGKNIPRERSAVAQMIMPMEVNRREHSLTGGRGDAGWACKG